MGTGFRTNKGSIAGSVRSLDLDVSLGHLKARGRCRLYRRSQARTHQEGCKVAPCDVSGMEVVRRLVFLVVCHGFSSNEFIAFGYSTASRNVCLLRLAFFMVLGEIDNFDRRHQLLNASPNHLSIAVS